MKCLSIILGLAVFYGGVLYAAESQPKPEKIIVKTYYEGNIPYVQAIAHHASISEVLSLLKDIRPRVRVVAMLDTLEYVRRSGRVSWARARLGGLLHVKPFVEVREGDKVISLGESRTRIKGISRLKELMLGMG